MSIKKAIKDKIEAVAEVSAASLVVYYGQAPQERAYPYAVFERVGEAEYGNTLSARQAWTRETFEIDFYGEDDEALETIRNAVIKALHAQGPVTWSTVTIHVALVEAARDLSEIENVGGKTSIARHQIELLVKYDMP